MKPRVLLAVLAGAALVGGCAPRAAYDLQTYPVIPQPRSLKPAAGWFALDTTTVIWVAAPPGDSLQAVAERWASELRALNGLPLPVTTGGTRPAAAEHTIEIRFDGGGEVGPEGYRLRVSPAGVLLSGGGRAGVFYGLQTLRQLLPPDPLPGEADWRIPAVRITDSPRFRYRGMHLDVSRHFFPTSFIKRYIDLLARYKLNVFHWHLTDDQGWRLQILKHPRLTEVGAYRKETILGKNFDPYVGDSVPYGGFYTQDEVRDIVAYARQRFVTIVPEIEMPGHSLAALAAYPDLACTSGPFEVATRWGVFPDIYCPSEHTFSFLEDVLSEVMDLFPGPYIHVGGDEAPKVRWQESDTAQAVMRREGLKDEDELQSYFIRRIERFLNAHGRRLIGWDEILEGGLAPEATVMSWRGMDGGIEAARQGHDVIMTPTSHMYFDFYQGDPDQEPLAIGGYTPLKKVYDFEPVPPDLTPTEAQHILGAQANVWTEYMATPEHVEYMVLPRMLALSEVVWSPRQKRNWDGFVQRLPWHLRFLEGLGYHYRIPDVGGLERDRITLADHIQVRLTAPLAEAEVHYTLDGSDPLPSSPVYREPLELAVDTVGVVVSARSYLPDGRASTVRRARFARAVLQPARPAPERKLSRGLLRDYFEGAFRSVTGLDSVAPERTDVSREVALLRDLQGERFGLRFRGFMRVPADGIYTFELASDDGSRLFVDGRLVVDHDGLHALSTRSGQVALARGLHQLEVRYFQAGGGRGLQVSVALEGSASQPLPPGWLFHE